MIQEIKMYTVVCNNCGKSADENTEYSCWNDQDYAQEVAMESGYLKDDENHYCPSCFSCDDEDNLILSESPNGSKINK